ncbi:ethanolamine ammonia-lyase subunit EutC [Magnetospirillum aberrantis]|uniref:Ethanolamine ammonia-lyase small subunit n=1 Tax=Magnetospirillum aberrantis SpK TaxID=908842 RepID=A0A7C9UT20_9PROT|nr:ethanolamine ammonia-lyase subunit EutC [Magnetospirillum aberrantis]NFV79767.1 ethanolamine ammonia-lyase subunit EutC [Magnetospirillum aberrantis SpK]
MNTVTPLDPWARFRAATRARIGLGRAGDALPTPALLDFQAAHAKARDAVHGAVDFDALAAAFPGREVVNVQSAAADRVTYLRRPDLGRRLEDGCRASLEKGDYDIAFVVADGLSAAAVADHAAALLNACLDRLSGWRVAPVVLARQGRVALGDDIGAALGARMVAVLIGERPGLSVANSLGVYLTWDPRPGRRDSERNCISNIHADGLDIDGAAKRLTGLMAEARRIRATGITLKEDAVRLEGPGGPSDALVADQRGQEA